MACRLGCRVLLAPGDEGADRIADAVGIAAMFQHGDAGFREMVDADVAIEGFGVHVAGP